MFVTRNFFNKKSDVYENGTTIQGEPISLLLRFNFVKPILPI